MLKPENNGLFCAAFIYGVFKRIEGQILPHFNVLMIEIGPLEAEKIKFSNLDPITIFL